MTERTQPKITFEDMPAKMAEFSDKIDEILRLVQLKEKPDPEEFPDRPLNVAQTVNSGDIDHLIPEEVDHLISGAN